jgi:hypothetical protein
MTLAPARRQTIGAALIAKSSRYPVPRAPARQDRTADRHAPGGGQHRYAERQVDHHQAGQLASSSPGRSMAAIAGARQTIGKARNANEWRPRSIIASSEGREPLPPVLPGQA